MHQQNLDQVQVKHSSWDQSTLNKHGRYNSIGLSNYVITWEVTQTTDHE